MKTSETPNKRKICALTANRADFSRIETILEAIKNRRDLELQLVVLGSHLLEKTGRTIEEIKRKGFEINHSIYMGVSGGNPTTMAKSVGLAIIELSTILESLSPDIVIAPVDRFESLAMGATPALMNIHVAHIQGGEVTGTIDESIRHALTKMAHLHFVATEQSRQRVIKMGEPEESVFNVGCPGTDLLMKVLPENRESTLIKLNEQIIKGEEKLNPGMPYLFVVQHPVTTEFSSASDQMKEILAALSRVNGQIIILWPNIDAGSDEASKMLRKFYSSLSDERKKQIVILKHIPTEIFVNVLRNASCQVGNSSSGIRETCYFGTPVVNIGSRQSGRERGSNVLDVACKSSEIIEGIKKQLARGKYPVEYIYGNGRAGEKIAEILATIDLPNIQKRITY